MDEKKPVIVIKPNNKKPNLLTDEQLQYIQKVLEHSCTDKICISRERLFNELKKPLKLTLEQYQFEHAITHAIRDGRIVGFETRSGRNGGICRIGAFSKKKRSHKRCIVTVNGVSFNIPFHENQIVSLVTSVLEGEAAIDGNVLINNYTFQIPASLRTADVLKNILVHLFKAKTKESRKDKVA